MKLNYKYFLFFIAFISNAIFADELIIIINNKTSITNLTISELSDIYLLRMSNWNEGGRIVPVNRESESEERDKFSNKVLKQSQSDLNNYWNKMHFKGVIPPLIQESDGAVLAFIKKVPGSIGYINANSNLNLKEVKILLRIK